MSNYSTKSKEELTKLAAEHREKLRAFRFSMAGGKVKNVKEGKVIRKEIARLLTALNKKIT
ncbi:MAG: 50S ribosomal protein L29 [Patescibacteria group bacterium]